MAKRYIPTYLYITYDDSGKFAVCVYNTPPTIVDKDPFTRLISVPTFKNFGIIKVKIDLHYNK